ncbi:translation elongation factor Ts [Gammaproteobacteria bacterium]|nr:translation elongation factor Ts [Gammaproteobacteria bacterium]
MSISASLIQEVRRMTDAPILKCKKALEAANGDKDAAIDLLRKEGAATALKKGSRVACEGVVKAIVKDGMALIMEINCETDFTARNDYFTGFVDVVVDAVFSHQPADLEALSALVLQDEKSVEQMRQELVGRIGENIQVRRFELYRADSQLVSAYQHGQKIGVIVQLSKGSVDAGRDVAMQAAATSPLALNADQIPAAVVEKERALFSEQVKGMDKPQNVIDNIIGGKLNKFLEENTLMGQPFVKDPKVKVRDFLKANDTDVVSFIRYELGEGIEKKTMSFADEVEQARGSV